MIKNILLNITALYMVIGLFIGGPTNPLCALAIPGLAIYAIEGLRKNENR